MMGFGPWESDWGQLRRGENEKPRPGAPTGMQRERLERRKASQGMDLRAPQQQKGMNGAAFEERLLGLPVIREYRSQPQGAPISHTIRWARSQKLGNVKCWKGQRARAGGWGCTQPWGAPQGQKAQPGPQPCILGGSYRRLSQPSKHRLGNVVLGWGQGGVTRASFLFVRFVSKVLRDVHECSLYPLHSFI